MGDHSARAHSIYGASNAHRWFACPGSVRVLAETPPRPQSPEAAEGTLAHEVLERSLRNELGKYDGEPPLPIPADLPEDMMPAVKIAMDHVLSILSEHPDAIIFLERSFRLPVDIEYTYTDPRTGEQGVGKTECFGTCDILIYIPSLKRLYVIDYKHGKHFVDVRDNKQLKYYALGAIFSELNVEIEDVVLTIIQPRCWVEPLIREWETTPLALFDFLFEIEDAIRATMVPDAPLVPDVEQQCFFCDAYRAGTCPAVEAKALEMLGAQFGGVEMVSVDTLVDPAVIDVVKLAAIKERANLIRGWLDQIDKYAFELARAGTPIPGFKLVEAQAKRKYEGEQAVLADTIALTTGLDLDEIFPRKLLGITDMEAAVKRAFKENAGKKRAEQNEAARLAGEFFAQLTTKQSSGNVSLVPLADPRPALDVVERDFGAITLPAVELRD